MPAWQTATLVMVVGVLSVCGQLKNNVTIGTGQEQGLVIGELLNGKLGALCYMDSLNVGEAVCAVLLGRVNGPKPLMRTFSGTTTRERVAGLNGCPLFKPNAGGRNINNDCNVVTSPEAAKCPFLEVECQPLELRHGTASEGLVIVRHNGSLGTVCSIGAGWREAAALCRTLNAPDSDPEQAMVLTGRYRPNASDPDENGTRVMSLQCDGAQLLSQCTLLPDSSPECARRTNQLAIRCTAPGTLKPWPSPTIKCYRRQADVCFQRSELADTSSLKLMRNGTVASLCRVSEFYQPTNQVCLRVHNYSDCSETSASATNYDEYRLLVRFTGELDAHGNFVRPPLDFNLFCQLSKESLATGDASVAPYFTTPTIGKGGYIDSTTVVELYRFLKSGNFSGPVTGSVEVGTELFARVYLKNPTSDSRLVVNHCWFDAGTRNFSLVTNKCPATNDTDLIAVNEEAMAVRFRAFLPSTGSSSMRLICSIVACQRDDPATECSRACADGGAYAAAAAITEDPMMRRRVTPPVLLSVHAKGDGKSGRSLLAAGPPLHLVLVTAFLATWL